MEFVKHKEIEATQLKQKYKSGTIVKINRKYKYGYFNGKIGVVEYTYSQKYWGNDYSSYSVVILDENSYPCNSIAWIDETELEVVSNDVEYGLKLIEFYHAKSLSNQCW